MVHGDGLGLCVELGQGLHVPCGGRDEAALGAVGTEG